MIYQDEYWPMQGVVHQVESVEPPPQLVIFLPNGQLHQVPALPRRPLGFRP